MAAAAIASRTLAKYLNAMAKLIDDES